MAEKDTSSLLSGLDPDVLFDPDQMAMLQEEPAGTPPVKTPSRPKPKAKPKTKVQTVRPDADEFSTVRKIPKRVMRHVLREFPDASNMTDALVAYLICHSPGELAERSQDVLTDEQKVLIQNWRGDPYAELDRKFKQVLPKLQNLHDRMGVLEVLCSYIVFDRVGFRQDNPVQPDLVDFDENGVMELMMHAEEQAKSMQAEKSISNGRPIR